jgi:hypothetical protein
LNISNYFYWTDSTIVLFWLSSLLATWKTFVAIGEIQTLKKSGKWFHVASKQNPADIISRGTSPGKLKENTLWFNGPNYLLQNNQEWSTDGPVRITETPDKNKASCLVSFNNYNLILQLIDRFSEFHKLI